MGDFLLAIQTLIINMFVLVASISIYLVIDYRFKKNEKVKIVLLSVVQILSYFVIMISAYETTSPKLIMDLRTILAGISALYFNYVPVVIGAIFGVFFRGYLGGDGFINGMFEIILPVVLGLVIRHTKLYKKHGENRIFLYTYSLILYLFALLLVITVPGGFQLFGYLSLLYLVLFPTLTFILSLGVTSKDMLSEQDKELMLKQEIVLASINSMNDEQIFALDENYNYLFFNEVHYEKMYNRFNVDIKNDEEYLKRINTNIPSLDIKSKVDYIFELQGPLHLVELVNYDNNYYDVTYHSIIVNNKLIGVNINVKNVTLREAVNEEIKNLNFTDKLTGLYNRRYYDNNVASYDYKENITIVYIDINGLKLINDSFGHHYGDDVIETVADILNSHFGNNDKMLLARTGGDEFIIITEGIEKQEVKEKMILVDKELENYQMNNIKVLISYGIANKSSINDSLDEAVKSAEHQMYTKKIKEMSVYRNESIKSLLESFREKYPDETRHSRRVAEMSRVIGRQMGMKSYELNLLSMIAKYHDIGKVALPDEVIHKNKLDKHESNLLKKHPEIGYRIVSTSPDYANIANDILSHHENFDGTGFPRGIKGNDIPLKARIISVVEMLDCLVYDRYGSGPISYDEAIEEIKKYSGTKFDPQVVKTLINANDKGLIRKYSMKN